MQGSFGQRQPHPIQTGSESEHSPHNHTDPQTLNQYVTEDHNVTYLHQDGSTNLLSSMTNSISLPVDIFEAELTAFLQGEVPVDAWNNWEWQ
jgi:hypothetical protein